MSNEDINITESQLTWCDRLWTSLKIGAKWRLPNVGVYVKTDIDRLVLSELWFSQPTPDAFGQTAFDTHDWVRMAGTLLNWRVEEEIELAYDWDGEQVDNWPEDRIGDVAICEAKCGAIIRAEPYQPGRYYTQMVSNRCPCCNEIGFSDDWLNHWVVIDDTATKLKRRMRGSEEE